MATRITTKQRAARQRNIVIARKAKNKGGITGRSTSARQKAGAKKYKSAFKAAYQKEMKGGASKKQARAIAAGAATTASMSTAMRKIRARATHHALIKGYKMKGAKLMGSTAAYIARRNITERHAETGSNMLTSRLYSRKKRG